MTTLGNQRGPYRGLRVLVTGGMGFIGSNLVIALVQQGAEVTVVDSQVAGCGANAANLESVQQKILLSTHNIQDSDRMRQLIPDQKVIFNLAGEISHLNSMVDPARDLSINCAAQLEFLELCRRLTPTATIVYASSRQVYGCPRYLPVDEEHPINPVDYNGIHKYLAEQYHLLLRRQSGVPTICLRLGNVYGPRQAIYQEGRGFIDAFVQAALEGQQISVFGEGKQLRGLIYVDDVVEAFLRVGLAGSTAKTVYNVGNSQPISILQIAILLSRIAGGPQPKLVPFPPERAVIDIGNFIINCKKFCDEFHWSPRMGLVEGLEKTLQFFQSQKKTPFSAEHSTMLY